MKTRKRSVRADIPISGWDRFLMNVAPKWAMNRVRAKLAVRNYEAASTGNRTSGWNRNSGDANAVLGRNITEIRMHARDLVRNNAWARRGVSVIANNTVGWGIVPKPVTDDAAAAAAINDAWSAWANSLECDAGGDLTFYGIQRSVMAQVAEAGEVLVRRILDKKAEFPLRLQLLEADFLDSSKDAPTDSGGIIVQGVELDKRGKRVAYWLFPQHPGSVRSAPKSERVPASEIIPVFRQDRPGQSRGMSWLAPVILTLKDLDEYEDATLVRQKVAAMFAAWVTKTEDGMIGEPDATDSTVEEFGPGTISYLQPGETVEFSTPPVVSDFDAFTSANLRKVSQGLGVTFEDLTGDYSRVNFSSARMARLAHWTNIHDWRFNMLIPKLCDGVWAWFMEALALTEGAEFYRASWTCPPMPMLEPDKEGLAYSRLVRAGVMTLSAVIREQGGDPVTHLDEYAADLKLLDSRGIKLDSDVRAVSQAGLTQVRAGGGQDGQASTDPQAAAADAQARGAEIVLLETLARELKRED